MCEISLVSAVQSDALLQQVRIVGRSRRPLHVLIMFARCSLHRLAKWSSLMTMAIVLVHLGADVRRLDALELVDSVARLADQCPALVHVWEVRLSFLLAVLQILFSYEAGDVHEFRRLVLSFCRCLLHC